MAAWGVTSHAGSHRAVVVIFGVTIFVFVVTRVIGDPGEVHAAALGHGGGARASGARRSASTIRSTSSSGAFVGDVVRLDFGESTYVRGQPALDVVFDYLPRTLQLVGLGMLIAVVFSIPLGVIAARKPGGTTDRVLTTLQPRRAVDAAVLPRLHPADHVHGAAAVVRDRAGTVVHEPHAAGDLPGAARPSAACRWWCARR